MPVKNLGETFSRFPVRNFVVYGGPPPYSLIAVVFIKVVHDFTDGHKCTLLICKLILVVKKLTYIE